MSLALILADGSDGLHDLASLRAGDPRQLLRPNRRRLNAAGGIAERETGKRLAVTGVLVGAVEHQQLVLDAGTGGEFGKIEHGKEGAEGGRRKADTNYRATPTIASSFPCFEGKTTRPARSASSSACLRSTAHR